MIILKSDKYQKYFFLVTLLCGSMFFVAWAHADITDLSKDQQKILDKKQNQVDAINAKIKAYNQIISRKIHPGPACYLNVSTHTRHGLVKSGRKLYSAAGLNLNTKLARHIQM